MAIYRIIVQETLRHTIEVEAEEELQAFTIAEEQRNQMDYNNALRQIYWEEGVTTHTIDTAGADYWKENIQTNG